MAEKKWSLRQSAGRVFENAQMAAAGIGLSFTDLVFVMVFVASFLLFGTLMNLLAGGTAAFGLLSVSVGKFFEAVLGAFLGIFGVGRNFWDWLLFFSVALLQGVLIGGMVVVFRERKKKLGAEAEQTGIAAGLAILGSGCPTCGTTLLAPLIGSIFGSSALAVASVAAGFLMAASILLAIWTAYKLGLELYVIMKGRRIKK